MHAYLRPSSTYAEPCPLYVCLTQTAARSLAVEKEEIRAQVKALLQITHKASYKKCSLAIFLWELKVPMPLLPPGMWRKSKFGRSFLSLPSLQCLATLYSVSLSTPNTYDHVFRVGGNHNNHAYGQLSQSDPWLSVKACRVGVTFAHVSIEKKRCRTCASQLPAFPFGTESNVVVQEISMCCDQ